MEVGLLLEATSSLSTMGTRGLLAVVVVLVGKSAIPATTTLLLLLLLLLHAIVVHARGSPRVAIPTPVTVTHVVRSGAIPANAGVGLVVVTIPSRAVVVLMVVASAAVTTASAALVVPSTLVSSITHVATAATTGTALIIVVRRGAIATALSHETLVVAAELVATLGGELLAIAVGSSLHAVGGVAHLVELTSNTCGIHVRRIGVLHGGHARGHAWSVVAWGSRGGSSGISPRGSSAIV